MNAFLPQNRKRSPPRILIVAVSNDQHDRSNRPRDFRTVMPFIFRIKYQFSRRLQWSHDNRSTIRTRLEPFSFSRLGENAASTFDSFP